MFTGHLEDHRLKIQAERIPHQVEGVSIFGGNPDPEYIDPVYFCNTGCLRDHLAQQSFSSECLRFLLNDDESVT